MIKKLKRVIDWIVDRPVLTKLEDEFFKKINSLKSEYERGYEEAFKKSLLAGLEGDQKELFRRLIEDYGLNSSQIKACALMSTEALEKQYPAKTKKGPINTTIESV